MSIQTYGGHAKRTALHDSSMRHTWRHTQAAHKQPGWSFRCRCGRCLSASDAGPPVVGHAAHGTEAALKIATQLTIAIDRQFDTDRQPYQTIVRLTASQLET
ncbi:predicted protein [Histoplasma capsulatum var. duboisii H88]|uniref:Predicted protein n=1 Tax=Ajellomyces capsulatus (strain H88) TaxID=544711 RepID=F0UU74_AJEC8|nr:predicted protein [Histoplasma capsulatum var. duboisii H88]